VVAQSTSSSKLSLDVRNVDVYDVLRMLQAESKRNIVIDNTTVKHDKITLNIDNVDFDTALRTVEMADGLQDARSANGIIYIGSSDSMLKRYADNKGGGIMTRTFRLENASVTDLTPSLTSALPPSTVIVPDARSHAFIITGPQATLDRAQTVISSLDVPLTGTGSDPMVSTRVYHLKYITSTCAGVGTSSGTLGGASAGAGSSGGGGGLSATGGGGGGATCSGDALTTLKQAVTVAPPNSIVANSQNDSIIATGTKDFLNSLGPIVDSLDQPGQQVLYEVRVVDLQPTNNSENYGLLFGGYDLNGNPTQGAATTSFLNNTIKINATLNLMVSTGHGSNLASPQIAVLNNHTADLLVGETYPISFVNAQTNALQVQFINIGVILSFTPIIGDDGDVTTDLHPEFSSLVGQNAQGIPIISDRKTDTVMRVKTGQSMVIAGLVQDIITNQVTAVPLLSQLPIFGGLFKNKNENHTHDELVFVITPHIVTNADILQPGHVPGLTMPNMSPTSAPSNP
jgi:type II secretory pathway component GspD/PulD (secretin)